MFLRLGLATVIVVGNMLMIHGQTSLFSYILFLIAASRLYDPLSGAMTNMAELFSVDLQVKRLKEIQEYKEEKKQTSYHTDGYDLKFDHVKFAYEPGKPVLKDAPVILLDEATASLDVDNETEIQEAISKLVKGKTVLVIAHRMRTVERADQIIVLADGVVAESGTHEKLMEKDGLYARLVKLQNASAEWKLNTREK